MRRPLRLVSVRVSGVEAKGAQLELFTEGDAKRRALAAVIDRLNRELQRTLALPDVRAQIATQSNEPLPGTPLQFGAMVRDDVERWARVVKSAGIKAD